MKIDSILKNIRGTETTKEASATDTKTASQTSAAPAAGSGPQATLNQAMASALSAAPSNTKTASAATGPVSDVMKIAEEIAGTERDAQIKHAQVMGTAFADAFVARVGQWQKTAGQIMLQPGEPLATATLQPGTPGFGKFAAENPGLVQQAAQMGYSATREQLEKQASDARTAGFQDTVNAIHKTAADEFMKGAAAMDQVLNAALSA